MDGPSGIVTLLTDFGGGAPYVAAMKGAILRIAPHLTLVDATHDVGPQRVLEGAFLLDTYWPDFPIGTVHVAVVDPGVGTPRPSVAFAAHGHFFVGPDNGVFSYVAKHAQLCVRLQPGRHAHPALSATFHGRDVFAPAAAHVARGEPLSALGPPHPALRIHPEAWPHRKGPHLHGTVLHVDRFGNVTTNFRREEASQATGVRLGRRVPVSRRVETYAQASPGEPVWLIGSSDRLEVAVRDASAAARLKVAVGDEAVLELGPRTGKRSRPRRAP